MNVCKHSSGIRGDGPANILPVWSSAGKFITHREKEPKNLAGGMLLRRHKYMTDKSDKMIKSVPMYHDQNESDALLLTHACTCAYFNFICVFVCAVFVLGSCLCCACVRLHQQKDLCLYAN
jgi:hypothetical protein